MDNDKAAGLTMMEVMMTITIAVVLFGLGSVGVDMIRRERVRSASRELFADLQRTRYEAMTLDAAGMGVRFESHSAYVLFKFDDCDHDYEYDVDTCENGGREESGSTRKILPAGVELKKGNPSTDPNNDILIFDRFGMPRTKNWAQGPMKFILRNPSDQNAIKCVVISLNRIREGLWDSSGARCEVE